MTSSRHHVRAAATAAFFVLGFASLAAAQDRGGNFIDNLFSRGEPNQQQSAPQGEPRRGGGGQGGQVAQSDPADLTVRLDRMENALRQLTGTIEQLQYR